MKKLLFAFLVILAVIASLTRSTVLDCRVVEPTIHPAVSSFTHGWGWPVAFVADSGCDSVGSIGLEDKLLVGGLLLNILFFLVLGGTMVLVYIRLRRFILKRIYSEEHKGSYNGG